MKSCNLAHIENRCLVCWLIQFCKICCLICSTNLLCVALETQWTRSFNWFLSTTATLRPNSETLSKNLHFQMLLPAVSWEIWSYECSPRGFIFTCKGKINNFIERQIILIASKYDISINCVVLTFRSQTWNFTSYHKFSAFQPFPPFKRNSLTRPHAKIWNKIAPSFSRSSFLVLNPLAQRCWCFNQG